MTNQCGVVRARHAVPYRSTPARRRVTSCDAGQPHAHSAAAGRRWDHKSSPPWAAMLRAEEAHGLRLAALDRKSTRLNSSHLGISYAVFCLKKKKTKKKSKQ